MNLEYFKWDEFACKHCNENMFSPIVARMLDSARDIAEIPFVLNSAYRCETHNKAIKGSPTSSHLKGLAVDIKCTDSVSRFKIVKALLQVGFTRILLYPTFVHVDIDNSKTQEIIVLM